MERGPDIPEVRTTIHLSHGGHVAASSDGYPEDWITPGHKQRTIYNNRQIAATLWYHDHAMGITRLNAMMGLAGLYILRDPKKSACGCLPGGMMFRSCCRTVRWTLADRLHTQWDRKMRPGRPSFLGLMY